MAPDVCLCYYLSLIDMTDSSLAKKFNLVLIGYRAVGKTTVGTLVAEQLKRPFIDLDAILEQEAGETILELVGREGWPEFRRREKAIVRSYAARSGQVLATGGGVILDPENTACLKATGKLVWLKAAPATIRERLSRDLDQTASRPGLTFRGTLDEVEEVLAAREPLYQEAAAVSLAVDALPAAAVARSLVELMRLWEQEQE
jgi:shikimate kinase